MVNFVHVMLENTSQIMGNVQDPASAEWLGVLNGDTYLPMVSLRDQGRTIVTRVSHP
uniref:Uncharacterized protein n=1 Tax=Anguilla anguilla TaxID=7936 RepID=A0A0E9X2X4_ANGAN